MAVKEFEVFVDIVKPIKNEVFTISTNDLNSIKVVVEVTKKKIPFDLTGKTARIAVQKPDGFTVIQDATITDPEFGIFEVVLDSQAYIVPGNHEAEIMIFDEDDPDLIDDDIVLVSSGFRYIAKKGIVDNETVESSNEWQSINKALVDGEAARVIIEDTKYLNDYSAATTYEKNNIVTFNGTSYMAKKTTKGNTPTDLPSDLNWGVLAKKGADGTGTVHVHKDTFIATEGQTVFTLSNTYDQFQNRTEVIVGYVPQSTPSNYQESSPNTITLSEAVKGGTIVEVKYFSEAVPLQGDVETTVQNHTTTLNEHETKLAQKITTFETVEAMKTSGKLKAYEIVHTLGYYAENDGGGARYIIKASALAEDGGSVITIGGGLQAILIVGMSVNYKMFGAKGDGINDDAIQIKKAHDFANAKNLPVINMSGEFWLKTSNNVVIMTGTQWGGTKFHIDESKSISGQRFVVWSTNASSAINLSAGEKTSVISQLKPGTTIIPELTPYRNCLVVVADVNDRVGKRSGYLNDWPKEDFFYVEEHGRIIGDITWKFNDYTSMTAYPAEDSYLTVQGGTFYLNGVDNPDIPANVGSVINVRRSRTIVKDQVIRLEGSNTDNLMESVSGFYYFNLVYDVLLENARLIPREKDRPGTGNDVAEGTYGIGGNKVLKATFKNVTAEGSTIHWGVFGTNLFKDFRVQECKLNRVDIHFRCWNLYIDNSEIGFKGFTVTGGGDLFINNTKVFGNTFLNFRQDYAATWEGDIRVKNGRLVATNSGEQKALFFDMSDFDHKLTQTLGRTIDIDGFVFDYRGVTNTSPAKLIKVPTFSKRTDGGRVEFPSSVTIKNVSVLGRDKGVRIIDIMDPTSFKLKNKGGYVPFESVKTNSRLLFENIELEDSTDLISQDTTALVFFINGVATKAYEDEYALYPYVEFVNCGRVFMSTKGMIADVYFRNCDINGIDQFEGGAGRSRLVFDNCGFKPAVKSDGTIKINIETEILPSFVNCTIHPPVIDGVEVLDITGIYNFITWNVAVKGNHTNTMIVKKILDYYATTAANPAHEGFLDALRSHHALQSHWTPRKRGETFTRPSSGYIYPGYAYHDTEKGKTVVWDGTMWKDPVKQKFTLGFYAKNITSALVGTKLTRAEGHPTQEYIMPDAGTLEQHISWIDKPSPATSIVFSVYKNGVEWQTQKYGAYDALNPRPAVYTTQDRALTFEKGDRLSCVVKSVGAGTDPTANLIVDILGLYKSDGYIT